MFTLLLDRPFRWSVDYIFSLGKTISGKRNRAVDRVRLAMGGRKRKKKFTAASEARRRAREVAGPPPVERVIANKRRKPPKHRKPLVEEAEM
jgi:hypothetical protein